MEKRRPIQTPYHGDAWKNGHAIRFITDLLDRAAAVLARAFSPSNDGKKAARKPLSCATHREVREKSDRSLPVRLGRTARHLRADASAWCGSRAAFPHQDGIEWDEPRGRG